MSSVDVIIPCYNYGRFLRQSVGSVLSQRDVEIRVLIIDDASSDDTADVGALLAASDPRVVFRRHDVNQGHIKTFNEGLMDWASATFTVLLSADDALTPGSLARATSIMDAHPEVGMTYGKAIIVEDCCGPFEVSDPPVPTYQIISGSRFLEHSCRSGNEVPSPAAIVRTSLQHRLGGYCPAMIHTSDMEMWMRIATVNSIAVIREPQAYYRWHGHNMTLQYINGALSDRSERLYTCEHVYQKWNGTSIPGFASWIEAMKQTFATDVYWLASQAFESDDEETMHACLGFAIQCNPALRHSAHAWKLRAKILLGRPPILTLRRTQDRLRDVFEAAKGSAQHKVEPERGANSKEFGWWPETAES
jgi:glycosyltransferase involved in cell wall biosynthesis